MEIIIFDAVPTPATPPIALSLLLTSTVIFYFKARHQCPASLTVLIANDFVDLKRWRPLASMNHNLMIATPSVPSSALMPATISWLNGELSWIFFLLKLGRRTMFLHIAAMPMCIWPATWAEEEEEVLPAPLTPPLAVSRSYRWHRPLLFSPRSVHRQIQSSNRIQFQLGINQHFFTMSVLEQIPVEFFLSVKIQLRLAVTTRLPNNSTCVIDHDVLIQTW